MGLAVTGMHYTGMAAVSVDVDHSGITSTQSSIDQLSFMLAMLVGPVIVLVLAAVVVTLDPDLVLGDETRQAPPARTVHRSARTAEPHGPYQPYGQRDREYERR
ncbi:MHYT domain-containing protein [Streptomyces sp. NBC_00876]|uniref:MHYT domain-containing protein n=1 Tax=Streptomyces sp. NBC_00876 TaxID=2975853 RepID=UPI00386B1360